mmetsp:Transcript_16348/g.41866  ORF Transcript_16348/g.41866 Transcript_16348/m.41866 type:complete len:312 (-) Transcript_16348:201-1136(-)
MYVLAAASCSAAAAARLSAPARASSSPEARSTSLRPRALSSRRRFSSSSSRRCVTSCSFTFSANVLRSLVIRFRSSFLVLLSRSNCCSASFRRWLSSRFSRPALATSSSRSPRAQSAWFSDSRSLASRSRFSSSMRSTSAARSALAFSDAFSSPLMRERSCSRAFSDAARTATMSPRCDAASSRASASWAASRDLSPLSWAMPSSIASIAGRAQPEGSSTRLSSISLERELPALLSAPPLSAFPSAALPPDGPAPRPPPAASLLPPALTSPPGAEEDEASEEKVAPEARLMMPDSMRCRLISSLYRRNMQA